MATPQLLKAGKVDYLVYDFLAEITNMARARATNLRWATRQTSSPVC